MSDNLVSVEMSHPMCIMRTKDIKHLYDRIEELEAKGLANRVAIMRLEAKLAKAVQFTEGVIRHAGNSGDDYLAEQARTTLAELTGDKDE